MSCYKRSLATAFCLALAIVSLLNITSVNAADDPWIVFEGDADGIGAGKHVVLVTGDEEYRSEEAMPMLAKILSQRHGFKCTVLFAINQTSGEIDPNVTDNIPGLQSLDTADLMVVFTRFRTLPDEQMKHVDAYLQTGKPIVGIRPAVVAFRNELGGKYAKYSSDYQGDDFHSGFGQQVLGATWISHHGAHGLESTRGIPVEAMKDHPILRGVETMWGPTDVYTVNSPIPHDGKVLVMGQVLQGMTADAPLSSKPQMPLAWVKSFPTSAGNARVFMSTMGDAQDFQDENYRRMMVNACCWAVGLEGKIPERTNVDPLVPYQPTRFGFNEFEKGRFPRDYANLDSRQGQAKFQLNQGDHICYIGNTLADRMQHFGWLETLVQSRFPQQNLVFRNLGFSADELTVRPRSMNFGDPHQHLAHSRADVVLAFFGYNESFDGEAGLETFRRNLAQFISETREHKYNGKSSPRLVLFSPIAHENLHDPNLPDGIENNHRLAMYTTAMAQVAESQQVCFVDLFHPTVELYAKAEAPLTINGIHLTNQGNRRVAEIIDTALFGKEPQRVDSQLELIRKAVLVKNLRWFNRYRATDGYSTYGQRSELAFVDGQTNYVVMQHELKMLDVMTANRDRGIWAAAQGRETKIDDSNVPQPLAVKTNIGGGSESSSAEKEGTLEYLGGEAAIAKMKVAKDMQVNLFASEEQFPDLVNPVQVATDTDGRLWVAAWHTYPHWQPNQPLNDKLLIFPDENRDGKADRCIVFADELHNPTGFEFWNGGLLVACAPDILFLKDTDGDDKADVRIRFLHGIDSADTHCDANSFVLGPDGCIYFSEGIFHFTNIETPWGKPLRTEAPMLYRWNPRTGEIANHFYISPNPHGNVIDAWGNLFATDGTTGYGFYVGYPGKGTPHQLYPKRVRPVAGAGMISGTHFPERNRGNLLICNTIGFLGVLQHEVGVAGADFTSHEIEPIVVSTDPNFRPVDVEIGGDGALYVLDWHNAIIGHMQHNLRDPSRDHTHGRIYRVTATGRPLISPIKMTGRPIKEVIRHLASPEDSVRYRARIELSGRDSQDVIAAAKAWAATFDPNSADDSRCLLEALWLHEQHNVVDEQLLGLLLKSPHPKVRAAATRVLGHWGTRIKGAVLLLQQQARDEEPLVRHEAVVAAAAFEGLAAAEVVFLAQSGPLDAQLEYAISQTRLATDKFWQQAVQQGKPLSPAGQMFVLRSADNTDLLRMPRNEEVCRTILERGAIPQKDRIDALMQLAKFTGQGMGPLLIDQISEHARNKSAAYPELVALLHKLPATELATIKPHLTTIASSDANDRVRAAAIAALVDAGEPVDDLFQTVVTNHAGAIAYLDSVALVQDATKRSTMYRSIRQLIFDPPKHLQPNDADASSGAALRALKHIPNHDAEIFADMAQVIQKGDEQRDSAIDVIQAIPREHWPQGGARPLANSLVKYIGEIPPKHRTSGSAHSAQELAAQLASLLPTAEATAVLARLEALRVPVIELDTVPHRMIYDKQSIAVQAGTLVEFRFSNSDEMPHNFVIVVPGSLEEVGILAEATGSAPDAAQRHYVPKSDKILLASRLIQPSEAQALSFEVPTEPGIYPYVCTFPGHWRRMNGSLLVVADLKQYVADPAAYLAMQPLPLRDEQLKYNERNTEWKIDDFIESVQGVFKNRAFDVGKATFNVANCTACHRFNEVGKEFGPDLSKLDPKKFTPEHILRSILTPSDEINEEFQTYAFVLDSGKIVIGTIIEETATTVSVIVDPLVEAKPIVIKKAQIDGRKKSNVSIMPVGLLSTLTREEILDLIAYVYARGDMSHSAFSECH